MLRFTIRDMLWLTIWRGKAVWRVAAPSHEMPRKGLVGRTPVTKAILTRKGVEKHVREVEREIESRQADD